MDTTDFPARPLHTTRREVLAPRHDPVSRIPTDLLAAETHHLLAGATVAQEILAAFAAFTAFAADDFARMVSVSTTDWFVVVGLAVAIAGRVRHQRAAAYLAALDLRHVAAASL